MYENLLIKFIVIIIIINIIIIIIIVIIVVVVAVVSPAVNKEIIVFAFLRYNIQKVVHPQVANGIGIRKFSYVFEGDGKTRKETLRGRTRTKT